MTDPLPAPVPGAGSAEPSSGPRKPPPNLRKHLIALVAAASWTLVIYVGYQKLPPFARYLKARTSFRQAPAETITFEVKPPGAPAPAVKESRLFLHYLVGDSRYTSLRFRTLEGEMTQAQVLKAYPPGSKLRVWYDPENPDRAYAEISLPWTSWVGVGLLVPLAALALALTRAALKQPHRKPG